MKGLTLSMLAMQKRPFLEDELSEASVGSTSFVAAEEHSSLAIGDLSVVEAASARSRGSRNCCHSHEQRIDVFDLALRSGRMSTR